MKIKALANKCSGCGDDLIFDPESQSLKCPSCHAEKPIKAKNSLAKHTFAETETANKKKNEEWAKELKAMSCPNCGAEALLNNFDVSSLCPYCGTSLVASVENSQSLKPDSVIPFKFNKTKAEQYFKDAIKGKFLIPKKFKTSIIANDIKGLYFPAFIFDMDVVTTYKGRLYENETITNSDGEDETRRNYFSISGVENSRMTNIKIEASPQLSQFELNGIKPYNLDEAKEFSNEFIYGYSLENYSNSLVETNKQAKVEALTQIRKDILNKYNHDGVDYLDLSPVYSNEKYNYTILPLYRINYDYKNKKYSNIMNGQTGKLYGKYPKSVAKILAIVFGIFAVVAIPILIFIISFMSSL